MKPALSSGLVSKGVPDEHLRSLIHFPEGSVGASEELVLLQAINALCKAHGYGRVAQRVAMVDELWRRPAMRHHYERVNAELREQLDEAFKSR